MLSIFFTNKEFISNTWPQRGKEGKYVRGKVKNNTQNISDTGKIFQLYLYLFSVYYFVFRAGT